MSDLSFVNCNAETTVTVPAWALLFLLRHADLADDGPSEEGWSSDEMKTSVAAIENAINVQIGELQHNILR